MLRDMVIGFILAVLVFRWRAARGLYVRGTTAVRDLMRGEIHRPPVE